MAKRSRSKQRRGSRVATDADATAIAEAANAATEEKTMDDNDASSDHDGSPSASASATAAIMSSNNPNKLEHVWDNVQSSLTDNLLPFLGPDELLTTLLLNNSAAAGGDSDEQQQAAKQRLVTTSQYLFRYIEHLAQMEENLKEMQKLKKMKEFETSDDEEKEDDEEGEDEMHQPCTLSGIPSLYTGQEEEVEPAPVDAETIWGQVDLQNNALLPRLKKLIKKLAKRTTTNAGAAEAYDEDDLVRVLDTGAMLMGSDDDVSDEEGDSDEEGGDDFSEGSAASNFDQEEEHDSDEDSEALRIRERMEKAMAEMSDDDDDDNQSNEDDEEDDKQQKLKQLTDQAASLESTLVDPTREIEWGDRSC